MVDLHIPVAGQYFDQIAAGTKKEEYRLRSIHWRSRLVGRKYDRVILTRGYPKDGGVEGKTRLTRKWLGYRYEKIVHPHFGPDPVHVFAIDVSTPASGTEARRAETQSGSVHDGPVSEAETPNS